MEIYTHFLHLKPDGSLHFVNLLHHAVVVSKESGKLASLAKTWTQQSGDLLD